MIILSLDISLLRVDFMDPLEYRVWLHDFQMRPFPNTSGCLCHLSTWIFQTQYHKLHSRLNLSMTSAIFGIVIYSEIKKKNPAFFTNFNPYS